MKDFWSENSKIIGKIILNQFGATFLGIMVVTAASSAQSQKAWLMLFASVFASLFYLFLVYNVIWEKGGQDRIKIDGGSLIQPSISIACYSTYITSPMCLRNSSFSFLSTTFSWRRRRPTVAIAATSSALFIHSSMRAPFCFITIEIPHTELPVGSSVSPSTDSSYLSSLIMIKTRVIHFSSNRCSAGRIPKRYTPHPRHSIPTQQPPLAFASSSQEG